MKRGHNRGTLLLIGVLCMFCSAWLGSVVERYMGRRHATMGALETQTVRLEARLTHLEHNNTRAIEAAFKRRFSRLGGVVRRQLIEAQDAAVRELRLRSIQLAPGPAPYEQPTDACERPCLDAAILYQEVDRKLFTNGGVLHALRTHVAGIRNIYILARSSDAFQHLLDQQTIWVDEARVPFSPASLAANVTLPNPPATTLLWLYQQALKFWFVQNLPSTCNNVMLVDSDTVFLHDLDPMTTKQAPDGTCTTQFKYNVATRESGAWMNDVLNTEIHKFVHHLTGLPKALADSQTAINHWQIMQRDVLRALTRSVNARLRKVNLTDAVVSYDVPYGVSTYEAYFSFVWHYYHHRLDIVSLPYVMRQASKCGYFTAETRHYAKHTMLAYFTCHSTYTRADFFANCKGREFLCGPSGVLPEAQR